MTFELGLILLKRFGQLLIIVLILSAYLYEKRAHKSAMQALATFKQQIHDADVAKLAENALKLKIAQQTNIDSAKIHADEQAQILNNFVNAINKGKAQNETTTLKLNTATANLEQLRKSVANSIEPMPVRAETASNPTESWRADNAALFERLDACKAAGALAASDYNELYKRFDANCTITGCQ